MIRYICPEGYLEKKLREAKTEREREIVSWIDLDWNAKATVGLEFDLQAWLEQ
jgi:hypothetical protein